MLAHVIYSLKGTARVGFQTHEEELTSWETCKHKLQELFRKPVMGQRAAKNELSCRAQTSTEPYVVYLQDEKGKPSAQLFKPRTNNREFRFFVMREMRT